MSTPRLRPQAYALFDTAIGRCGIAWTERGVCAVQIPEGDDSTTQRRLLRQWGDTEEAEPPPGVATIIDRIVALLGGGDVDFADCALDLRGTSEFEQSVYRVALAIPAGRTLTYGDVAAKIGDRSAARAVGRALGDNPVPIIVPCHRVVAANGKTGGFSAPGGAAAKQRMLAIESAHAAPDGLLL